MFEADRMEVFEADFKYSAWDETNYFPSDLNVTLSAIQLRGGVLESGKPMFAVKIVYGLEYNSKSVFSLEGTKMFSFPIEYASIHLLSFLTEVAIKKFHEEFLERKRVSAISRHVFFVRTLDEIFDDLIDALNLIRLEAKTNE